MCVERQPDLKGSSLSLRSVTTETVSQESSKICASWSLSQQAYKRHHAPASVCLSAASPVKSLPQHQPLMKSKEATSEVRAKGASLTPWKSKQFFLWDPSSRYALPFLSVQKMLTINFKSNKSLKSSFWLLIASRSSWMEVVKFKGFFFFFHDSCLLMFTFTAVYKHFIPSLRDTWILMVYFSITRMGTLQSPIFKSIKNRAYTCVPGCAQPVWSGFPGTWWAFALLYRWQVHSEGTRCVSLITKVSTTFSSSLLPNCPHNTTATRLNINTKFLIYRHRCWAWKLPGNYSKAVLIPVT